MGAVRLRVLALVIAAATVGAVSAAGVATASGPTLVAQATGPLGPTTSTGPASSSAATPTTGQGTAGTKTSVPPTDQERRRVTRLRRCLQVLKPTDRRVLSLRYGIGGRETAAVDAVAQRTGLSIARVQQIERRALPRLRRAVAAGPLCGAPIPAAASPAASTKSRSAKPDSSPAASSSNSSSRHYTGLVLLILGVGGLAGVLVYTMREVRRSL